MSAGRLTRGFGLVVLLVALVALLLYLGRGQVMIGDDLFYAQRLAENSLGHAILYSNVYVIALPMVLYKLLFATVGIEPYWVYRLLAAALSILCAGLVFLLARQRAGRTVALALAAILAVFGPGGEVILTGNRLPSLFAIAAGLGGWLALRGETRRGDAYASLLLTVSVTSHPSGLGFLAGAAVLIWLRPEDRWRSTWILAAPAVAAVAIQLFFQTGGGSHATVSSVLAFQRDSWIALTAAVSGLSQLTGAGGHNNGFAQALAILVACFVVGTAVLRRRQAGPQFWASLAALAVLITATRLAPQGYLRIPWTPRYLYPAAALLMLALTDAGAAWRDAFPRRALPALGICGAVLLTAALVSSLVQLRDAGSGFRRSSEVALGQYGAYQLDARGIDPEYRPSPFLPSAGAYLTAARAFGDIGPSPEELQTASPAVREAADIALVRALGLELHAGEPIAKDRGRQRPEAHPNPRVTVRASPGCARISARPTASGTPQPQVLVTLPPGGATIQAPDRMGTNVYAYRFADSTDVALPWPTGSRAATLVTPVDNSSQPWTILLDVTERLEVCGFTPLSAAG